MTLRAMTIMSLLCACEGETDDDMVVGGRADEILALTGDVTNGEMLYQTVCSPCHLADGAGGVGSNVQDTDAEVFVDAMLNGRSGMISYAEQFNDQQIADIAAFGETL